MIYYFNSILNEYIFIYFRAFIFAGASEGISYNEAAKKGGGEDEPDLT